MTQNEFDTLLERRIKLTREVLASKAKEYATNTDKLANLRLTAVMAGVTPISACWVNLCKHLAWLSLNRDRAGEQAQVLWDEKVGDAVNYLVLLEACAQEMRPSNFQQQGDEEQEMYDDMVARAQPVPPIKSDETGGAKNDFQLELVPTEFAGKYVPVLVNPSSPGSPRPVVHGYAKVLLGDVATVEDGFFHCSEILGRDLQLEVTDGERCFVCEAVSVENAQTGYKHYFRSKHVEAKKHVANGHVLSDGRMLKSQLTPNIVEMMLRMGHYRDDGVYLVPVKEGDACGS